MKQTTIIILCLITLHISTGLTFAKRKQSIVNSWTFRDPFMGSTILTFRKDQRYELDFEGDGYRDIWGKYSLFGQQITLQDEGGKVDSTCFEPGVFTFSILNDELRFSLVADQCVYRAKALNVIWMKAKVKEVDGRIIMDIEDMKPNQEDSLRGQLPYHAY